MCFFQDYPSVNQLSYKIAQKKINVIFAITEVQMGEYEELSRYIEGSVVGKLANDSNNIVELVRDNYNVSMKQKKYLTVLEP